jgi:putative NADH-flavin reductase
MKVLVFGASGGTGRELVRQALAQGHIVSAFVRDPAKLDPGIGNLKVVQGDVAEYASVERGVRDHDAVLCALGAATPLKRDPVLVQGVRHIIQAMERAGVRKLVYLSFLGVRDGRAQLGLFGRYVVAALVLRNVVADHEEKEGLIRQSRLDWVIVRAPKLTNGQRTGRYRSGEQIRAQSMIPTISRADLADFMLRQLTSDSYLQKTPSVIY